MSHGRGKSDCCVVPKKPPNKAAGEAPAAAAEAVEGRRQAKGNAIAARMSRRLERPYDMGTARVRALAEAPAVSQSASSQTVPGSSEASVP
jgi:hypothetical protein